MFKICAGKGVDKTVLVIAEQFLHRSKTFLLLAPPHPWGVQVCTRSWEGIQPGQLSQIDQRRIIQIIQFHEQQMKLGGRKRDGNILVIAFIFPRRHYSWQGPALLEVTEHLPTHGKWWISCWFSFVSMAFASPIKLSLSQATKFFFSLIFSPISGSEWGSSCMVLSCWLGLNHDSWIKRKKKSFLLSWAK